MKDLLIDFLNNALIVLLVIGVVLFFLSFSNIEEEPPKRKQGNVQVPTLVEIYPENTEVDTDENTEVDTDTETVILSPQTGGFWREKVMISVIHLIWIIPLAFMGGFITCITLD